MFIEKMKKINLGVIFGAKSAEHEVSIVTTFQAWEWINREKYNPYLIYISPDNQGFLCPELKKSDYNTFIKKVLEKNRKVSFVPSGIKLEGLWEKKIKIDAALLLMHGAYGEDGRIQGMLDFLGIPYTGSGVLGSALGMDKVAMKDVFCKLKLPVVNYLWFWDKEFRKNEKEIILEIEKKLGYPVFVKPARGGSSIGVTKVERRKDLKEAIKKTSCFDHKILVEEGIEGGVDINCAVMGGYEPVVSVCEQPISEDKFLSFKEKYLKGGKAKGMAGLSRIIPAPIPPKIAEEIRDMTKVIFKELDCWGMARMDFLYQPKKKKFFPNEINTIPGSLAFYLWEASGIKPSQLIDKMISLAFERKREIEKLTYTFKSKILSQK